MTINVLWDEINPLELRSQETSDMMRLTASGGQARDPHAALDVRGRLRAEVQPFLHAQQQTLSLEGYAIREGGPQAATPLA